MRYNLQTLQPVGIAILFAVLFAAEHVFPQHKIRFDKKHDFKNIMVGAFNLVIVFTGGFFLGKLLNLCQTAHVGLLNLFTIPVAINIILQITLIDLVMYWWHRVNHLLPFFWRFHRFHHTDPQMNSTTTLRFHPVEQLFSSVMKLLVFPIMGFSDLGVLVYGLLFFPVILVHHSNIRVSDKIDHIYRKVFISPWMHRIHHSRIKKETDSNYGSVFPVWDIIFRSYTKKPSRDIQFGTE